MFPPRTQIPRLSILGLAILLPALFPASASAGLQLVETKGGRIYEATDVLVVGDRLRMQLALPSGQEATVAVPIDTILPEQVYYAWASQIAESDVEGHTELARWCRKEGLFRQAWRQYVAAGEASEEVKAKLPELEQEMNEEAATWSFERAERLLQENDVASARVMAERVLEDYPDSKEVPRTKGLLQLIADREQFLSEQKAAEARAERAKNHRRYIEKQLKEIDSAKLTIRNTRMKYVDESRRRLYWASYSLRRALHRLDDLVPFVQEDDLRKSIEAIVADGEKNLIASFTRLADLRYLQGDIAGALDAAHEVLWLDPDNKAMSDMRKRVLDNAQYGGLRYRYGYYDNFILRRHGYLPPFAVPYRSRVGFGIQCVSPFQVRRTVVAAGGGLSLVRYVR